jgi:hypothetical protein
MQTLQHDLLMRSIKIIDIGYLSAIYAILALICAKAFDRTIGEFDAQKESLKPKVQLSLELVAALWSFGVLIYAVRNVVELFPFPLNGYKGYKHSLVKELGSTMMFTITFFIFNQYLHNKISFYYNF